MGKKTAFSTACDFGCSTLRGHWELKKKTTGHLVVAFSPATGCLASLQAKYKFHILIGLCGSPFDWQFARNKDHHHSVGELVK